jgi:hypothetical protein
MMCEAAQIELAVSLAQGAALPTIGNFLSCVFVVLDISHVLILQNRGDSDRTPCGKPATQCRYFVQFPYKQKKMARR